MAQNVVEPHVAFVAGLGTISLKLTLAYDGNHSSLRIHPHPGAAHLNGLPRSVHWGILRRIVRQLAMALALALALAHAGIRSI